MRPTEARDLLKPAQDMLDDLTIWDNGQEGLAVFLSPGDFGIVGEIKAGTSVSIHDGDTQEIIWDFARQPLIGCGAVITGRREVA